MSALRSVRYEPVIDVTWVGEGEEGEEEEEDVEEDDDMDVDGLDDDDDDDNGEVDDEEDIDDEDEDNGEEEEEDYRPRHTYNHWDRSKAQNGHHNAHRHKQEQTRLPKAQALPIAVLPDDYDGQVLDGATYLAISARVNATLPNYTRMPIPPPDTRSSSRIVQSQASSSRHPALPSEAWSQVFPLRFKTFRARLKANWSPDLPYPAHLPSRPRATIRGEVWQYIRGCRRKLVDSGTSKDKGKGKAVVSNGDEAENDEEAAMNGPAAVQSRPMAGQDFGGEQEMELDDEDEDEDEEEAMNTAPRPKVLEEEAERHRPHEPLVSALQGYTSIELVSIIELITTFISETLDLLSPFVMIPNDPSEAPNNPFPEIYMRWLFACLLLLDDTLDGQSMSSIRDLARTVMKVAAWRWIRAVTDKEISADEDSEWKYGDTPTSASQGEAGLEATLGRCWIIFHAVVSGWAQRDLLDDLESMFK